MEIRSSGRDTLLADLLKVMAATDSGLIVRRAGAGSEGRVVLDV